MKPISPLTAHTRKIKEIRDRMEDLATKGPWKVVHKSQSGKPIPKIVDEDGDPVFESLNAFTNTPEGAWLDAFDEDLEFIAQAPEDVTYLLDRVERLTQALKYFANGGEDKRVAQEALNGEDK